MGDIGTVASREPVQVFVLGDSTLELDDVRIGFSIASDIQYWLELRVGHVWWLVSRARSSRESTGALRAFAAGSSPYIWLYPV